MNQTVQRTNFVIVFEGRSGSTFLVEALDSHPDVVAKKEAFAAIRKDITAGKYDRREQALWLREFFASEPDVRALGFKVKYKDIVEPEETAKVLRDCGAKIIRLTRMNRIKLVVSLMNGRRLHDETGDWNRYDGKGQAPPLLAPLDEFDANLRKVDRRKEALVQYVAGLSLETLELYYEDILQNADDAFGRVCDFLGVKRQSLRANTRKNTPDNLSDALANYEELRAHYVGTPYEAMFAEVDVLK